MPSLSYLKVLGGRWGPTESSLLYDGKLGAYPYRVLLCIVTSADSSTGQWPGHAQGYSTRTISTKPCLTAPAVDTHPPSPHSCCMLIVSSLVYHFLSFSTTVSFQEIH